MAGKPTVSDAVEEILLLQTAASTRTLKLVGTAGML